MHRSGHRPGRSVSGRFLVVAAVAACALAARGHLWSGESESTAGLAVAAAPGGFIEKANSTAVRPNLTGAQVGVPARGAFTFPAPWNTQAARITNATDCGGGGDCVTSVGYSYWRNMNNSAGSDTLLMFLTLRGAGGPTLFSYNKDTGVVTRNGPLFDSGSPFAGATGEGWYFSATMPHALYVNSGATLYRYDVVTRQLSTVFNAAAQYPGTYIWQIHSSNDDRVHSATLRSSSNYSSLGCLVYREDVRQFTLYQAQGSFDECQIDKSGRWLLIKENVDGAYGEDNVIVDLSTGARSTLLDQGGAAGHSDNGYGYVVYSDNWHSLPNAVRVYPFGTSQGAAPLVHHNADWGVAAPAHISHANARSGLPLDQQFACGSSANRSNTNRANEIVCFRLDTSLDVLVVAPVMTSMNASGGGDDYSKLPKGNLDPTGEFFLWTTNLGTSRQDAFIVRVPGQLLVGGASGDTTPPVISSAAVTGVTEDAATILWVTNEASDSQVEYGADTSYGSVTALDFTPVLAHTRTLAGLTPGTLYHARARSRDASGNLAVSADLTFTTGGAPQPPPSDTPIAHWKLDEASGALAVDATGNGRSGSLVNGPQHVAGRLGGALAFDGLDDKVTIPHATALDAYPLTVSFWMSGSGSQAGMINKYLPSSFNGYQVFLSGGNLCAWYFRDAASRVWDGTGCTLATPGVNDGQWHHVAFVVDASGGRLYVDGVQRAARAWTGSPGPATTTQPLTLGEYPATASPFLAGRLDDVRLYNRALAASEIAALSDGTAADTAPPVITRVYTVRSDEDQIVRWTTDEPGDSQVEYGTSPAFGSTTPLDATAVLEHRQVLTGLRPRTLYYYRVRTRDQAGNLAVSKTYGIYRIF